MTKVNIDIEQTGPQRIFTESDKKFRVMVTGVGAGKTACGWHNSLKQVFGAPGSLGVIVAPTYSMIRDVILRERGAWIPDELIASYNKTDKEMKFINGSSILFRSAKDEAQIERLRGLSVGWSWIDEATLLPKLVLDVLTARLRQPGQEGRYKLWMTCTPRKGWLWDMIQEGLSDEWYVLDGVASDSNVFLPEGYTESLKALYTGQFYDQEVLGQWVDFEGLVWNVKVLEGVLPDKMVNTWYGIDVGWEHPTAIIVIKEMAGIYYVVDEYYEAHTNDDDLMRELKRLWGVWGSGRAYVDPSVPRVISRLNKEGLHAQGANNKVMDGLRVVRALFDTGKLFIDKRCINLIREIEGYVWKDGDKEEPEKINDDACDCLRYGLMGATNRRKRKGAGVVRGQ